MPRYKKELSDEEKRIKKQQYNKKYRSTENGYQKTLESVKRYDTKKREEKREEKKRLNNLNK